MLICSELERAKQQAAASYQELMGLRSCLEESTQFSTSSNGNAPSSGGRGNEVDLGKSVAETDQLLSLFRESFAQLSDTQHMRLGNMAFSASSSFGGSGRGGNGGGDSAEVSVILEKYSDRLVELVANKMAAKLNSK